MEFTGECRRTAARLPNLGEDELYIICMAHCESASLMASNPDNYTAVNVKYMYLTSPDFISGREFLQPIKTGVCTR